MKTILRHRILHTLIVFTLISAPSVSFAQPPNNLCANAIALNGSNSICTNTAGTLVASTNSGAEPGGCGGGTDNDVWYTFVAATTNPTISVTAGPNRISIQLFSGICGGLTSVQCVTTATTSATLNAAGLTIGATYYIRIFSNNNSSGTFNICITNASNNLCSAPINLFPDMVCNNALGTIFGSTLTGLTINAPNCAPGGITRDVWYRFVAQTTNPTITLSGLGPAFTNPGMQLLSNNCGGTFNSYYCGTTSIAANYLTPGTTYFLRVYTTTAAAPGTAAAGAFSICITDPVSPPPANDDCAGAVNLSVLTNCTNVNSTMAGATPSAPALGGTCTGPNAYDVWFKFTAINNTATITLSSIGANFTNPGIEVLTGTCGSFTSFACGTGTSLNMAGTLTAGTTYYVRVYSRTAPPPNGNARFNICITSSVLPVVRYGNSYVNITKQTTGGVVEPGDILEIRMSIQHISGTLLTNARYVDNIPTNTAMLTGPTDFIRIITNEGLTYKQYTTAAGDDAATYLASPPAGQFNVRMNLGFGTSNPGIPINNTWTESASATGNMSNAHKPTLFNNSLIFATAYRVMVTGAVGQTITINPAQFIYRAGGGDITLTATPYQILISEPLTLCSNSIGVNNAAEFGGSFGTGSSLNRATDLTVPISGYSFENNVTTYNNLGDGRYAIVKNISPRSGTNRNANRVPNCGTPPFDDPLNCANRMHGGHWYVDGDHTGTNNNIGNVPPDPVTNAGYMLMVNADYVASEVYSQTLNNLCPNTYYEFSGWFRNICRTCGSDSLGRQFNVAMPPALQNGYPGVYPNLSFSLNGLDYYSTGEIDTVGWLKKGFVFRTGPAQTSATFSIRNNSQGGGGNDWVMDDIAVATCLPTMSYSPTINPNVCYGNAITIADTISSFFDNYTTYKWQRSTNGGASWTDITGVTTLPDTNYYITSYTVTPSNTTLADSGDLYRVVVATTAANLLDPNCNISDGVTITLSVNDCGIPLKTDLLSFNGKLVADKSHLTWTTSKEEEPVIFDIERSSDGSNFVWAGSVNSYNNYSAQVNTYSFIDPLAVNGKVFYRLIMKETSGAKKYSRIIQLSKTGTESFSLVNVVNPFSHKLDFDISALNDTKIEAELVDLYGKVVAKSKYMVRTGINALSLPNTENLSAGTYILRIKNNDLLINRKVLKKNF